MSDRDFKGVWIPKEIWLNEELTMLEKVIFVEIDSLDGPDHCYASNEYFATFCNCSESKVSKAIKKLKELGMIEEVAFDGRHRKLRVVNRAMQSSKKCYPESQKVLSNNIASKTDNSKKVVSKDTTTEFSFGKKSTPKKENLYTKCLNMIDAKTTDATCRLLLRDWLNMLLEKYRSRGKVLYVNVFKGKLNMLDKYDEKDWADIIRYNIQRGYEGFYPINDYSSKPTDVRKGKAWEEGLSCETYTEEEKQEIERLTAEREARGEQVWY